MGCAYFNRRFKGFSNEKKEFIAIALGGIYHCPACKKIHKLEVEKDEQPN